MEQQFVCIAGRHKKIKEAIFTNQNTFDTAISKLGLGQDEKSVSLSLSFQLKTLNISGLRKFHTDILFQTLN